MDNLQKCSQCLELFNQNKAPLQLSSCSHYICQTCLKQALSGSFQVVVCAFCQTSVRKEEIVALPAPPQIVLNSSRRISCLEKEALTKCAIENEGVLLECDDETNDSPSMNEGLCQIHNVQMDIVCISDKERICPHCALFGNHKDHRFKRIQDFEKETKEKMKVFNEITAAKDAYYRQLLSNPMNTLEEYLRKGKQSVKLQIKQKIQSFINSLKKKELKLLQQLQSAYQQLEEYCKRQAFFKKMEVSKTKLQNWAEECKAVKQIVIGSTTIQKKISHYYNSPLQIASEGYIYLQQLKYANENFNKKICQKVKEVRVLVDSQMENIIQNCLKLEHVNINSFIGGEQFGDSVLDDRNPFMDCSQIGMHSIDTLVNNSIEVDITSLSSKPSPELTKTVKKPVSKHQIKSLKSIEKKQIVPNSKKFIKSPSKLILSKQNRISQVSSIRSPSKVVSTTSLKQILPGTEIKSCQIKQPQKIYNEFSKNTLTDFFDISDCNLPSEKVVEYVHRARKIHKIRGLKLSSNHLNTQGFQKMLEFLKGVGNINLANNEINQGIFDLLLKNRDRVDALKIINLSHNPISFEKKTNSKIEQLKKMGLIVIL